MLQINDLCKSFDDKCLFNNFNLSVDDGEFVVFKGESGCGKTTLLHMIGGLEKPDSGTILFNGNNINDRKYVQKYLKNEVGFLFQNFALIERKNVYDNLNIVKKQIRSQYSIDEVLEYVGLSEKKYTEVYKLSGGEQQRIALARLMLKKCSIILADEPTGSLDSKNAERVIEILSDFNKNGKTIIMVTHSDIVDFKKVRLVSLE